LNRPRRRARPRRMLGTGNRSSVMKSQREVAIYQNPLKSPLSKGGRLLVARIGMQASLETFPLKKGEEGEATAEPSGGCGERV
jgi:hypothetical protein